MGIGPKPRFYSREHAKSRGKSNVKTPWHSFHRFANCLFCKQQGFHSISRRIQHTSKHQNTLAMALNLPIFTLKTYGFHIQMGSKKSISLELDFPIGKDPIGASMTPHGHYFPIHQ
jgi:hypothetical protein